jgi:hypothetical protein
MIQSMNKSNSDDDPFSPLPLTLLNKFNRLLFIRGFDNRLRAVRSVYLYLIRNKNNILLDNYTIFEQFIINSYLRIEVFKYSLQEQLNYILYNSHETIPGQINKSIKYYNLSFKTFIKWKKIVYNTLLDNVISQYYKLPSLPFELKTHIIGFITPKGILTMFK